MDTIKRKTLKAFTLLELMIVIAIVAILTAIIIPNTATYIRDSKMTAANDQAQQIYMATQEYLVSLQVKGEKVEDYIGLNTSGEGVVEVWSKPGEDPQVIRFGNVGGTSTAATRLAAAKAIEKRMSSDLNGVWVVFVYPKTYTVKRVTFCDKEDLRSGMVAGVDGIAYQVNTHPYTSSYNGNNAECQEWDIRFGRKEFVGQYPIG